MGRHAVLDENDGDISADVLDNFRRVMDPDRVSVKDFMECFRVQTKRPHTEDGKPTFFPRFRERKAQSALRMEIERQWNEGHGARIVGDKDRTQGWTTFMQFLLYERFCRAGGGTGKCVSRKDEATEENFQILKSLMTQTPPLVFPRVLKGNLVRSNQKEVRVAHMDGRTSVVKCITSGDKGMGRGGAVRWWFIDEFAWWERGKEALGGALESWDDVPGNFIVIVSTGRGKERFYRYFMRAKRGDSRYKALFYGWLDHPEKHQRFDTAEEKLEFAQSVGMLDKYGPEAETNLVRLHHASLEQLKWRREAIDDPKIDGDLTVFNREHPTTWEDSFLTLESAVFPAAILAAREDQAIEMDEKCLRGELFMVKEYWSDTDGVALDADVEFRKVPVRGGWRIYEEPRLGEVYAFGCDPAEGRVLLADGKTEGDYSTILMREVRSQRIAAIFRGHVSEQETARQVILGSAYFGRARGYVERNNHGHAVIQAIEHYGWGEILLTRERLTATESGKKMTREVGFLSKKDTKPTAVSKSRKWVLDLGMPVAGSKPEIPLCLLSEMQKYERDPDTGRIIGASEGHDDVVTADYLCHEAVAIVIREIDSSSPVREKTDPLVRYLLRTGVGEGQTEPPDADLGEGW